MTNEEILIDIGRMVTIMRHMMSASNLVSYSHPALHGMTYVPLRIGTMPACAMIYQMSMTT